MEMRKEMLEKGIQEARSCQKMKQEGDNEVIERGFDDDSKHSERKVSICEISNIFERPQKIRENKEKSERQEEVFFSEKKIKQERPIKNLDHVQKYQEEDQCKIMRKRYKQIRKSRQISEILKIEKEFFGNYKQSREWQDKMTDTLDKISIEASLLKHVLRKEGPKQTEIPQEIKQTKGSNKDGQMDFRERQYRANVQKVKRSQQIDESPQCSQGHFSRQIVQHDQKSFTQNYLQNDFLFSHYESQDQLSCRSISLGQQIQLSSILPLSHSQNSNLNLTTTNSLFSWNSQNLWYTRTTQNPFSLNFSRNFTNIALRFLDESGQTHGIFSNTLPLQQKCFICRPSSRLIDYSWKLDDVIAEHNKKSQWVFGSNEIHDQQMGEQAEMQSKSVRYLNLESILGKQPQNAKNDKQENDKIFTRSPAQAPTAPCPQQTNPQPKTLHPQKNS